MANKDIFRDFSLNFKPNPITGDISVVKDEKAIAQSLKNIILTNKYDVPFDKNFGGDINDILFELATPRTAESLRRRIQFTIEKYEPRIELDEVVVTDSPDNNAYDVKIKFTTILSETETSVSFFLERIL